MIRTLAGTVAGYILMALLGTVAFSLLWLALGAEFAFENGTLEVTPGWILFSLPLNFLVALFGGWMAVHVGRSAVASGVLCALVLAFGALSLGLEMRTPPLSPERQMEILSQAESGKVGNLAVGPFARRPTWFALALPLLGGVGALVGGRFRLTSGG